MNVRTGWISKKPHHEEMLSKQLICLKPLEVIIADSAQSLNLIINLHLQLDDHIFKEAAELVFHSTWH